MTRSRFVLSLVGIVALVFSGGCACGDPALRAQLNEFSLRQIQRERPTVASAIQIANAVLGPEVEVRFVPGWAAGDPDKGRVRVYEIVPTTPDAGFGPCATLPGSPPIVLFDPDEFARVRRVLAGPGDQQSELRADQLLAILLLHEAGHIHIKHGPAFVPGENRLVLNEAESDAKTQEIDADRFAAHQIRDALAEPFPSPRMPSAASLALLLPTVSFNLMGNRTIDNFGISATNPRAAFWDASYSHPNTELRFLVINHELRPSASSQQLIDSFLEGRSRGRKDQPVLDP